MSTEDRPQTTVPVDIRFEDGSYQRVYLVGVPRFSDFIRLEVDGKVKLYLVARIEWGTDGIPTVHVL